MIAHSGAVIPPCLNAIGAARILFFDPIVRLLLGADFHRSGDVLQGMAPYVFFAGLTPLVTLTYSYLGEAGLRLRISIVSIVLDSVVTLALLPPLGLTGAVLATDIAAAYYVPVHLWFLRRRHGVALRPLLVTGMRTALAVAAGTAVLVALGTGPTLPIWAWVVGAITFPLVYGGVLLGTGEVTRGDLAAPLAMLRRPR